jgi:hypothetical protein
MAVGRLTYGNRHERHCVVAKEVTGEAHLAFVYGAFVEDSGRDGFGARMIPLRTCTPVFHRVQ